MAEIPTPLIPLPKGDGAETKKAKVHAKLGGLTFEQYKRLPHKEQMAIDAAQSQGLTWHKGVHPETGQAFWSGKRSK